MRIRVLVVFVLSVLLGGPASAQILPIPPGWQMQRAILLMRHGVRSPLHSNDELANLGAQPWPTWPVPPGFLTPRGADLMRLMGRYYRVLYGGRGLIQTDDCPPLNSVVAWTDTDERTRMTGAAVFAGMYPRCASPLLRNQDDPSIPDPLFFPTPSASCPMDFAANRAAVLARIGGDFSSVLREYAPQLDLMQATLCPPGLDTTSGHCGLPSAPPTIQPWKYGIISITGAIGVGSSVSENFLLESAEGMPASQVAWGRLAGDAALRDLLKIHRLHMDLTQKTLAIARQRGSNLLVQISAGLQDGHKFPGIRQLAEPVRLGMLVGHDINIANVARLLNVGWQIPGFQPNEASPGGALAFELLRDVRTNRHYVRMAFYAQTLEQMRDKVALDLAHHPGMVAVDLPACERDLFEKACPLERFVEIVNNAIEPGCVTIKP
jgi:4-phytase/acid phosphatase